jgi:hypothetical protein
VPRRNGSKSAIIARLQEHDNKAQLSSLASGSASDPALTHAPAQQPVHHAVTLNSAPATPASAEPAPGADAPGIPPADMKPASAYPKNYLDIKLPDLTVAPPEAPMQIVRPFLLCPRFYLNLTRRRKQPYGPDFWHSTPSPAAQPTTVSPPKLLVVAGSADHPVGGNVTSVGHTVVEPTPAAPAPPSTPAPAPQGFFAALAEDVGLPTTLRRVEEAKDKLYEGLAEKTEVFGAHGEQGNGQGGQGRPLDEDEKRGVWVLGALIAGSWLAAGYFQKGSSLEVKKKAEHAKEAVEAKAAEAKGKTEEKAGELKGRAEAKAGDVKAKAEEVKDKAGKKVDEAKGKVEETKDKASKKVDEAKGKVDEVKDKASKKASEAKGKVEAKVDEAKGKAKETYESAKDKVGEKVDEAKAFVKGK